MNKTLFMEHLNNQKYDKTYQDIECIDYKGYSESYKTWENIRDLVYWPGKYVVDLGSFHGYFCFKVAQKGANVKGFEGDPFYAEQILQTTNYIKEMNESINTQFFKWDCSSDELIPDCDVVLCLNVLHHFADPDKVLSRLNCNTIILEINIDQLDLVKKYFKIDKEVASHRPGRIIVVGRKEVALLCLDFSNICNYRCLFCEANKGERILFRLKDFKGFDSIIQKTRNTDISGYGEADLHPDFVELVTYLTKYNKRFSFVTNGSLLDKNMNLLVESSMYLLNVSVNSLNVDTYYKQTGGKGDLKHVLDNIDNFYALESTFKRPWGRQIQKQFSFVITAYNFRELFDFVDYVKRFKTEESTARVVFRGLSPTLMYPDGLMPIDNEENRDFLESANRYALESGLELETFSFDMNRIHRESIEKKTILSDEQLSDMIKRCTVYEQCLFIGSDGNVGLCDWTRLRLGNVKESSIDEIKNSETYLDLIKCIKEGDLKYCMNCRREG